MDKAVASERNEAGLRITPASERLRPLSRATQIEHRLTQRDHLAVDDPSEHRRHLVCGDGDHGLVQQRHTLGSLAGRISEYPRPSRAKIDASASAKRSAISPASTKIGATSASPSNSRGRAREHLQPGLLDAVATALAPGAVHRGRPSPSPEPARPERRGRAHARTRSAPHS